MDCTDFRCREPWPFIKEISTIWFSHKFKGPGLRYEIAISISTGNIVWANRPFPCGVPDLKIFRQNLRRQLTPGEKVVADQGYNGNTKILTTLDSKDNDHKKRDELSKGSTGNSKCLYSYMGMLKTNIPPSP